MLGREEVRCLHESKDTALQGKGKLSLRGHLGCATEAHWIPGFQTLSLPDLDLCTSWFPFL